MSFKKSLVVGASFIASNIVLTPQIAFAQDEETVRIDEVIVTARKREESLQDVPLAVTALDKAAIDNLHTSTITCLLYTSPSPRDATLSRMPSSA